MNKENQIHEIEGEQLIDELSKMPPMVIATAYLHAINYTLYGVDVTEKWLTATQQAYALEGHIARAIMMLCKDQRKVRNKYGRSY